MNRAGPPDGQLAIAANLGFLFRWVPFLDRFSAAKREGFAAVEIPWPNPPIGDVVAAVRREGLRVSLLNVHAGVSSRGDRGYANDPARREQWRAAFDAALQAALLMQCPTINVLAGNWVAARSHQEQMSCLEGNLSWALERVGGNGPRLMIEVLNRTENPSYLFTAAEPVVDLLVRLGEAGLALQFDAYHLAFDGGDPAAAFRSLSPFVGHVQIADYPGRHEPGTGAMDLPALFRAIGLTEYRGAIGLEYVPSTDSSIALEWLPRPLRGRSRAEDLARAAALARSAHAAGKGDDERPPSSASRLAQVGRECAAHLPAAETFEHGWRESGEMPS